MPRKNPHIFERMKARRRPPIAATAPVPSDNESGLVDAAEKWGFALAELMFGVQPEFERNALRRYYRDPADPNNTWSGSGQKPDWVRQWEAEGRSLSELEVRRQRRH